MMRTSLLTACLATLALTAACGKKDGGAAAPAVTIDPAAVNALVPAALKDKLVFEKTTIVSKRGKRSDDTYVLAGPKGWEVDAEFSTLKPPGGDMFDSSVRVTTNCNGMCQAKDWAAESDKASFQQFTSMKVLEDKKGDTNRLVIAESDDKTYVMYAWWTKSSRKYAYCFATLKAELREAAPAFAKACQAIDIQGEGIGG